jgi:lipoate---protein ligase
VSEIGQEAALRIEPYELEDDLWRSTAADSVPRLRVFAVSEPMVVLGRGSKPELELELEPCLADRVPLRRRRGGGCAVVLDEGNVVVAASFPVEGVGDNTTHFRRITRWVIGALDAAGAPGLAQDGISDLVLGDRKVGGACIYRARAVLHYSVSLLVRPRLELIERYLRHPPREPGYRRGRGHRDFLDSLESIPGAPGVEELVERLARTLGAPPELG